MSSEQSSCTSPAFLAARDRYVARHVCLGRLPGLESGHLLINCPILGNVELLLFFHVDQLCPPYRSPLLWSFAMDCADGGLETTLTASSAVTDLRQNAVTLWRFLRPSSRSVLHSLSSSHPSSLRRRRNHGHISATKSFELHLG